MSPEFEQEQVREKPPEWWHNAIRNNLPGFLPQPYYFESLTEISENGIPYMIQSMTKGAEAGALKEGIFIEMRIPESIDEKHREVAMPILSVVHELLKKEVQNVFPSENLNEPSVNPEYLGLIPKVDLRTGINATFSKLGDGYYVISLNPLSNQDLVAQIKGIILDKYFIKCDIVQRIKKLNSPLMPNNLKKIVIHEQGRLFNIAIKEIGETAGFTDFDLTATRNDQETQQIYLDLLKSIETAYTAEDYQNIKESQKLFNPLLNAGFLDFYQRYCEKKYY